MLRKNGGHQKINVHWKEEDGVYPKEGSGLRLRFPMVEERRGFAIIFHSGSYDRLSHGLSIALAALALGRPVRFFFTYWALPYLRKGADAELHLDSEAADYRQILQKNLEKGTLERVSDLIAQTKALGAKFYTCTHSMSLLNIARNELVEEVDRSMGLTTFLTETPEDQILFI